ncbi:MAG: S41 family peptidase [Bacteroidia bacterium]
MRRIYLLWAFIHLSFGIFAQDLTNPGFEALDENRSPKSWKPNSQPFDFLSDSSVKISGNYSMLIRDKGLGGYGAFSQRIDYSTDQIRKFRLSGYMKTEEVSEGFAGLWLTVYAGEKVLFFDNMGNQAVNGTHDWTKYEVEFYVDETVSNIVIGGLMAGKGKAWFDDYHLEEILFERKPPKDSITQYLNEVVEILRVHSLMRDSVDFDKLLSMAKIMAAEAQNPPDVYPIIRYMLNRLGDNHSFLLEAERAKAWANTSTGDEGKPVEIPQARGEIIQNDFGYITMPGLGSGDPKTLTDFADSLQNLIRRLDKENPKAWIVDLRNNTGGNCWPMLAGIGPVLGEGVCGYFIDVEGNKTSWGYKKGASRSAKRKVTRVTGKPYKLSQKNIPVAVLTGPSTASSGEIVTVAFRERPNTRSFGQPTQGLSTGNRQFRLSDGSSIFLTSSVYADRTEHLYGHKIAPDEIVDFSAEEVGGESDTVIEAAIDWLSKQ